MQWMQKMTCFYDCERENPTLFRVRMRANHCHIVNNNSNMIFKHLRYQNDMYCNEPSSLGYIQMIPNNTDYKIIWQYVDGYTTNLLTNLKNHFFPETT
jgi:hypothetical protein